MSLILELHVGKIKLVLCPMLGAFFKEGWRKGERGKGREEGRKKENTNMNNRRKCGSGSQNKISRTQIWASHKEQLNEIPILASVGTGCLGKSRDACHLKYSRKRYMVPC